MSCFKHQPSKLDRTPEELMVLSGVVNGEDTGRSCESLPDLLRAANEIVSAGKGHREQTKIANSLRVTFLS